jgi:ribosomal protein L11 methyltransferase
MNPGMTVIDVGTGSGILAEAAVKLGAGKVAACDSDEEAVAVARENFARAGVEVDLTVGSAEQYPDQSAELIVANISPAWIRDLAHEWVRILKPNCVGVLSGFEAADVPSVSDALAKAGATVVAEYGEREWRMLEITV